MAVGAAVGGTGVGLGGVAVGGLGVGLDGVTVLMVMWGAGVAVNRTAALVGAEVSVGANGGDLTGDVAAQGSGELAVV